MSDRFPSSFLLISTVLFTQQKSQGCLLHFPSLPSQSHQGRFLCTVKQLAQLQGWLLFSEEVTGKATQPYEIVLVYQHKKYCLNTNWHLLFNHIFTLYTRTWRLRKVYEQIFLSFLTDPACISSPSKPFCMSSVEFCLFVMWNKQIWAVNQNISVCHKVKENIFWSRPPKPKMCASIPSLRKDGALALVLKSPCIPGWKSNLWTLPKHTSGHRYADGGVHSIWCNVLQATYRWNSPAKIFDVELTYLGYKVQGISGLRNHKYGYFLELFLFMSIRKRFLTSFP